MEGKRLCHTQGHLLAPLGRRSSAQLVVFGKCTHDSVRGPVASQGPHSFITRTRVQDTGPLFPYEPCCAVPVISNMSCFRIFFPCSFHNFFPEKQFLIISVTSLACFKQNTWTCLGWLQLRCGSPVATFMQNSGSIFSSFGIWPVDQELGGCGFSPGDSGPEPVHSESRPVRTVS